MVTDDYIMTARQKMIKTETNNNNTGTRIIRISDSLYKKFIDHSRHFTICQNHTKPY